MKSGGSYVGKFPDGRTVQIHRIIDTSGSTEEWWVDVDSGTWAWANPDDGKLWGPAKHRWGTNNTFGLRFSADGTSATAYVTNFADVPLLQPPEAVPLIREFQYGRSASTFGFKLGRFGATLQTFIHLPSDYDSSNFARAVEAELWQLARQDARDFRSVRWEQQWEAARWAWPATSSSWSLEWTAQPRLWRSNLISVAVYRYPDRGGNGDPSHWKGMTFLSDQQQSSLLTWNQFFDEDAPWAVFLKSHCEADLARHLDHDVSVDSLPTDNFTVTTQGLQLLFDPYEVASGAEGAQMVHIPWSALKPFLRPSRPRQPGGDALPLPIAELMDVRPN